MVVVDLPSPRGVGVIPATTTYFPSWRRRGQHGVAWNIVWWPDLAGGEPVDGGEGNLRLLLAIQVNLWHQVSGDDYKDSGDGFKEKREMPRRWFGCPPLRE